MADSCQMSFDSLIKSSHHTFIFLVLRVKVGGATGASRLCSDTELSNCVHSLRGWHHLRGKCSQQNKPEGFIECYSSSSQPAQCNQNPAGGLSSSTLSHSSVLSTLFLYLKDSFIPKGKVDYTIPSRLNSLYLPFHHLAF